MYVDAEILPLLVSGLTASLALDEVGQISKGDTVLGKPLTVRYVVSKVLFAEAV